MPDPLMRIPFRKPFRIFLIALLATVVLIAATSAVLSLFYEQAVIRYMKKYLDEHLLTQISMDDIRFSVLKGFPNATVEINHVVMFSGDHFSPADFKDSFADTLLKAQKISFQFNMIKLFHKVYELKRIEISHGFVNILFDNKGNHNLTVWKSNKSTDSGQYSVNLKSILLSDMHIRWVDLRTRLKMTAFSAKTSFRGSYSGSLWSGDTRGIFSHASLLIRNKTWMNNADMAFQLKMLYSHDRFRVRQGNVRLNKADISLHGEYKSGREKWIDLSLTLSRFGLGELMSLLPIKSDSLLNKYRFAGNGSLKATLKGPVSDPAHLQILSDFNLSECSARNLKTKTVINHILVSGTVSGTQTDNFHLTVHHFTSTIGKGSISGNLEITNLHDMLLQANISSDLDLSALQDFMGMDTIENMGGMIRARFRAEGKLGLIRADSLVRLLDYLKNGTFIFQDAGIKMKKSDLSIQHITGKATLNHYIYLDSMMIRINENDLRLSGKVQNLNDYLFGSGILKSELNVSTDYFSINSFLRKQPVSSSGKNRRRVTLFPGRMHLNAHLHADDFEAGKFRASDLSATLSLIGDSLYIPAFSLKFPDGLITGDALISQNREHVLSITCNSVSKQINIQQLFTSFNNFTQNFIVDRNVKGKLNGNISFFSQWDSTLQYMPKSLKAKGNLEIIDGELVQFEPMQKLSKYINVDELRLIRFKTLRNEIFIEDRLVTIPEMDIHSSAFNISVSGQQSFDNVFEYRLNVLLSEVLFNKARNKKKEMDDFLVEEDRNAQTKIPLIIAGTPNNFDVKFDRKRAFDLTRKNMAKNRGQQPVPPKADNFSIEWDENKKEPVHTENPASGQKQDDFIIEWNEDNKPDKNN
jgi:hypothetical protein